MTRKPCYRRENRAMHFGIKPRQGTAWYPSKVSEEIATDNVLNIQSIWNSHFWRIIFIFVAAIFLDKMWTKDIFDMDTPTIVSKSSYRSYPSNEKSYIATSTRFRLQSATSRYVIGRVSNSANHITHCRPVSSETNAIIACCLHPHRTAYRRRQMHDCVTLVLLVRGVELTIVLLLGDEGEALGACSWA